ncbi:50S ribosomal protein L24 [Candidatus Micrarchaeota archaeon]|nr:50S ribosomal protein L24 [Candidatus Micrarchaeota archaeon]MBD3418279.1 50S ribosomal protein L24 [Candidatus Micrarchaeota archaeon]
MKRRKERKKKYSGKMHEKKALLNVHVAKELKEKVAKRAVLVNKGDTVTVMRGAHKGKSAKVKKVSHAKGLVYLEGMTMRNARGVENMAPFQPSNLKLTALKESEYRKKFMKGE